MHPIDQRLRALNLVLPAPPQPAGRYLPVNVVNGLGYVSGQFPLHNGTLTAQGVIGADLTVAAACQAMRVAVLNSLAHIRHRLGGWELFGGLVRIDGFLVAAPHFTTHPHVLDAASELFAEVLGNQGLHARTVFGVASLPLGSPLELVVQFYTC